MDSTSSDDMTTFQNKTEEIHSRNSKAIQRTPKIAMT